MSTWRTNCRATFQIVVFALWAAAPSALHASPTSTPQEFAPGVISTGHEFTITFTPDGRQACFSRSTPGQPLHIFCSRLLKSVWQQPQPIAFSSDQWSDLDPFFTPDGKRMFFISTKPHAATQDATAKKNMDIWAVDRNGDGWGTPYPIENINSDQKEGSPTVASDGTLYFFSDRSRAPNTNSLYESTLTNGAYANPVLLPLPVNSPASDTSPFVTPNGNLLLFYSDRAGGLGKGDLYAAVRRQGRWQTPIDLGPSVNTSDDEYNPELSPDGHQLYFGRNGRIYTIPVSDVPPLHALTH